MRVSMIDCKKKLTIAWLIGSGLLFFLLIFQSFSHYGQKTTEAWSWFLPTIMPVLSLILGAWGVNAIGKAKVDETVDRFAFGLSFGLSVAYLVVVGLTILLQPFIASSVGEYIETMNKSNLWLAPFQGLVTASIGVFFAKGEQS